MPTLEPHSIYDLPAEVLSRIFDFLPLGDLLKNRLVDWRFKWLSDTHPIWKFALELYFPHWQVESRQTQAEPISYQAIFGELHQAFFIGLTPEECEFFDAVLSNNLTAVEAKLKADPFLVKASSASGYKAIYYAAAYQRDELVKVLRSHRLFTHKADLDFDLYLGLKAKEAYQSQKSLKESIKYSLDQLSPHYTLTVGNFAANHNFQLDEQALDELSAMLQRGEQIEQQKAQRKKKKRCRRQITLGSLCIVGLSLLGLGISLRAGAPLWLTLLGATASTVGYISLGLGISALLVTLMGLWLYKGKLTALRNHAENTPLLQHEPADRRVSTSPVTPPGNPIVNSTQPSASPAYSQAFFLTANSLTNATSRDAVNSARAQ